MAAKNLSSVGATFISACGLLVPFLLILGRTPAEIACGLTGLGFLARSTVKRDWAWIKTPWVIAAITTCAYLIICAFFADYNRDEAFERASWWFRFPLFAAAIAFWVGPMLVTQRLLRPFLFVLTGAVMIDTLVQLTTGTSLTGFPLPTYPGRLSGPFGNDLIVGVYLTRLAWPLIGLMIGWAFVACDKKKFCKRRLAMALLMAAALGLSVLISGERMAYADNGHL